MSYPCLTDVLSVLDEMYPPETAHDWDSVGLVSGDPDAEVRLIHFAVDPVIDVIREAVRARADLLVTHHPLLLRGVHSVAWTSAKGEAVTRLIKGGTALYNAHTNADDASPGVSDALARTLGLDELRPLIPSSPGTRDNDGGVSDDADAAAAEPDPLGSVRMTIQPDDASVRSETGTGRIGRLPQPMTLERFAMHVGESLPFTPQGIRISGAPESLVQTVAVCGGAGDGFFDAVRAADVDVYVTADLRHHPASEAREEARGGRPYLVDVSHWASEWPWLHGCASRLQTALADRGFNVEVRVSDLRTDPWTFRVPSSGGVVR